MGKTFRIYLIDFIRIRLGKIRVSFWGNSGIAYFSNK